MVEVTVKEIALIEKLKTEITSGMVLYVKTAQDVTWNRSRIAVLAILDEYKHSNGLLQQEGAV